MKRLTKKFESHSTWTCIQGNHGKRFTDLASLKSSLDLGDSSTKDILAALSDNVGTLFAAIKFDKLASRVDNEGCEVVPHLGLLLGLHALALAGKLTVYLLETTIVLQRSGTLCRC